MATNPMVLTADDVLDIPVPPDLRGHELVDGVLVPVTPASPPHGRIIGNATEGLAVYVRAHGVTGEIYIDVGYVLGLEEDPERMRSPDVSFVSDEKLRAHGGEPDHGWFRLVPDLAIEVDSPARKPRVAQARIEDYVKAGVRLLWVLHTESCTATVYRADGSARFVHEGGALEGEDVLSGLSLPLEAVFRTSRGR